MSVFSVSLRLIRSGRLTGAAGRRLALSMCAAISARLGLLLLAVIIGRHFGPSDYGAYTFATSIALLAAQVAVLGWPMLMNRLIPEFIRNSDWDRLRGLRDAGDALIICSGLLTAAMLALSAVISAKMATAFLLSTLLVVPFATSILRRQQLAAFRRPAMGLFFDQGFGATLTALFLLLIGVNSIIEAVLVFAVSMVMGNVITTVFVRRLFPPEVGKAKRTVEFKPWMAMAWPMLIGMSSKLLMNKMDVLMLAPLAGLHESGLYGAAFRITFLLTFPQVVLMSVITPLMSEAFAHGRHAQVRNLLNGSILFAVATALPASLVLMMFPQTVLATVFGAPFVEARPALIWLALGQLATSLSIPFQSVLTMGGREKNYGTLNFAGLGLHVVLNLILIPRYGAMGAAVSTAVVCTAIGIGQVALNRTTLKGE